MGATDLKAQLLELLRDDPDFRAAVQALMPPAPKAATVALTADVPAAEPVFHGPRWLRNKATGPHAKARFTTRTGPVFDAAMQRPHGLRPGDTVSTDGAVPLDVAAEQIRAAKARVEGTA